jgi:hypothetical protein
MLGSSPNTYAKPHAKLHVCCIHDSVVTIVSVERTWRDLTITQTFRAEANASRRSLGPLSRTRRVARCDSFSFFLLLMLSGAVLVLVLVLESSVMDEPIRPRGWLRETIRWPRLHRFIRRHSSTSTSTALLSTSRRKRACFACRQEPKRKRAETLVSARMV